MLFILLLLCLFSVKCQYQDLYKQITGKLRGFQELGYAWSLTVGREGFEPLYIFIEDINRAIAEESQKSDDTRVPNRKTVHGGYNSSSVDIAKILCDAHEIVNDMLSQFQPSIECKEDLLAVFRDKLWHEWMGAIDRFNSAICDLNYEERVRIDLTTMKPIMIADKPESKFKKLHGHIKQIARSSINRLLGH